MGNKNAISFQILSSGWGKMEIEQLGRGKDFKLWPGGGRDWDWSEFGTGHGKGVQPQEVEELIAHGCQIVILTTGRLKRLKVRRQTVEKLEDQGVRVIVAGTKAGIKTYNEYAEKGAAVGGLFHSTC